MEWAYFTAAGVLGFFILLVFKGRAIKAVFKNAVAGLLGVGALNLIGGVTGVSMSLNVLTIITSALLGLPGILTLFFMRFIWNT